MSSTPLNKEVNFNEKIGNDKDDWKGVKNLGRKKPI
jgi:hypothetical protein